MAGAWKTSHNPDARPKGCNGKYGASGAAAHRKASKAVCPRCSRSEAHYRRERRRGGIKPRKVQPCGTNAAARRHRSKGEELCFPCRVAEANYQAELRSRPKEQPEDVPKCGTNAGWSRHQRRGEPIDDACRAAHNAYALEWSQRKQLTVQT